MLILVQYNFCVNNDEIELLDLLLQPQKLHITNKNQKFVLM